MHSRLLLARVVPLHPIDARGACSCLPRRADSAMPRLRTPNARCKGWLLITTLQSILQKTHRFLPVRTWHTTMPSSSCLPPVIYSTTASKQHLSDILSLAVDMWVSTRPAIPATTGRVDTHIDRKSTRLNSRPT